MCECCGYGAGCVVVVLVVLLVILIPILTPHPVQVEVEVRAGAESAFVSLYLMCFLVPRLTMAWQQRNPVIRTVSW
jgi:hypothetical protein